MRKVLSFVLVLSLVLGSFGMAFAAPLSDVAGEKCEDAVNVLTQLGVVSGYPDGEYKPDNIVTRAEMAVIVVRALGLADYAIGTSNFSDMGGHWSNPYVAYATSLGVIAGYPDGTFKPDKTVSYDEAATMLVAALGYTPDSLTGTWPANYVVKAKSLGILDGIKAGAAGANRGDIAIMTFQTLDALIGTTDKDGKWTANEPDDNMLARLGAELYNDGDAFVVDGDEDSVINLRPFLGSYVTAYQNDDEEIIALKEVKSVYLTGKYKPGSNKFETSETDYNIASNLLTITHPEALAFVNGEVVGQGEFDDDGKLVGFDFGDADAALLEDDLTIAAKVSGKRITELYSVAAWDLDNGDHFLFEDDMLEDDNLNGNDFVLDNNDEIDLASFELLGVSSLEDIDEDNVVYVYNNSDGIARIAVGTEVVTGEITKVTSSGKKITVDGKAYAMYDDSVFSVGLEDEVELYLDYFGDVYDVELVEGGLDDYAVLLETASGTTGLNGEDGVIKLFLADGTDKVFTVDDDLVVDGVIAKDGKWIGDYEGVGKAGTLVEYGLDKDGVIEALEIVDVEETDKNVEKEITSKGYFDGKAIASDVLIFTYDDEEDPHDEDAYGVTTLDKVKGNDYKGVQYLQDDSSRKITLMLIPGEGSSDDEVYGLVTGWFKTTASDTDYMGTFLVDGKEVEYELTSNGRTAVAGADAEWLYLLKFNSSDQVTSVAIVGDDEVSMDAVLLGDDVGQITTAYTNGIVEVDDVEYTVASDAVAYEWDVDDEEYSKVTIGRSKLSEDAWVALYDLDEDGVADIILINENFKSAP